MRDLISRDVTKNYIDSQKGRPFIGCTIGEAMKIMFDEVPSAEPERKWIPCSERLPDWDEHRDDMVLVCYGNGSIRFDACMNGEWVHGNPIAWMPLPEPWRGE